MSNARSKAQQTTVRKGFYQRLTLVVLFAVFFVPILVAWWMNLHPDYWRPSATVNNGTLVIPSRPIDTTGLTQIDGRAYDSAFFAQGWTLVLLGGAVCQENCTTQLIKMRQARLALGKEMDRVQRLYAALEIPETGFLTELLSVHPGLHVARANAQWLSSFELDGNQPTKVSGIYLIDPEGRLMMHYRENANAEGILDDLQRLLKISKIG